MIFKLIKIISLPALLLLLFYPLKFCPFGLPYLYCFICYLRCPWGQFRGYLLVGLLGLNLQKNFYCFFLCPWGQLQDLQHKIELPKLKLPRWVYQGKYFILGVVIVIIFLSYLQSPLIVRLFFSRELFFYILAVVFATSFFIHRPWCNIFCPLRALSEITLRVKRVLKKTGRKKPKERI